MLYDDLYLAHHGVKGQRWGIRRYQNSDGSLTAAGRKHYQYSDKEQKQMAEKLLSNEKNRRKGYGPIKVNKKDFKKIDPNKIRSAKGWFEEGNLETWDNISKLVEKRFKNNPSELSKAYYKIFPGMEKHGKISDDAKIEDILDMLHEAGNINKELKNLGIDDSKLNKRGNNSWYAKYYWEDVQSIARDLVGEHGNMTIGSVSKYLDTSAMSLAENYVDRYLTQTINR